MNTNFLLKTLLVVLLIALIAPIALGDKDGPQALRPAAKPKMTTVPNVFERTMSNPTPGCREASRRLTDSGAQPK